MNNCVFVGNISREPELRFVPASGTAVVKFGLAVNDGWGEKKTTSFLNMVAFSKTAEAIANYVTKGSKVTIRCHVKTGSYDNKDSIKIYTTDFIVDEIEFPSKKETSNTPSGQRAEFPDEDNDIFQPVTDDSDIPF